MVSALWKACSDGLLDSVIDLLNDPSAVDIEIKDHAGVTPLIEAIKNGHVDIVRVLLERGADPMNASSHGRPEQYTSDPSILELINFAQNKAVSSGLPAQEHLYHQDATHDSKHYYSPPPPGAYTYYPSINSPPPVGPEGSGYYPPPSNGESQVPGGPANLPPPEVARFIPCRYFPACRYGSSCLFAHPQAPYFQGPLPPPAQYAPPYDPMSPQPYAPNYYPVPPPPFQPPNIHHMTPISPQPGPPMMHGRTPSDILSPAQTHFSPNGVPAPLPYGPMSPTGYSHAGQVPLPMSIPPLPPHHHQPPLPQQGPPPSGVYGAGAQAPPFTVQQDASIQYPTQPINSSVTYQDVNVGAKSPPLSSPLDTYAPSAAHRDGMAHNRRGTGRRGSFGGRKPPCLFFPAGRCKNGDDCRFPHVLPDGPGPHHPPYFSGRGGGPRPRGHMNGHVNGFGAIDEKFASVSPREEQPRQQNGAEGSSRSHSTDPGNRPRYPQGVKNPQVVNGRPDKKLSTTKQRVPNPDEFPVLSGSTTPPSRSPGLNGSLTNGSATLAPTAAQVLQAPPPTRKDSLKESSTRGATPDPSRSTTFKESKIEMNGDNGQDHSANKIPISFAAVATAAPDISKEVSVSA